MTLQQYLSKINTLYLIGNTREHSYRGDLQNLVMAILPDGSGDQRTRKSGLWST